MNKKSARRRRKNLITKLAMTSALTLGVGATAVMTEQTEVRAEGPLYSGTLNMRNKEEVERFAEELKKEVKKNQNGGTAWQKLTHLLEGYKNLREEIETKLADSEQTRNMYGKQLGLTEQAYQSEKAKKEKLEGELQASQQQNQELNAKLDSETKEKQELQEQLRKEKEEKDAALAALQEQLNTANQKVQELEATKADLQAKLSEQEQLNAKLKEEVADLTAQLEKLKHCQDKPMPEPKPEPKPEAKKPEQPKPMTKPGAKKPEQSLPSTGDIRNPFFTPAAIAIMIAAGTIAIPKRKEED
ncbi:M-like protein [Streptococcus equi subsp. zooepidemicus]|uniref:LPXTG cell wall anchor domain-containing protein n=1 Tax=Streptococcus equi TaxID=1336 RepID=UPI000DA3F295|nr:M-like protein [Streptococcus equi subsp. zooepidemicus]